MLPNRRNRCSARLRPKRPPKRTNTTLETHLKHQTTRFSRTASHKLKQESTATADAVEEVLRTPIPSRGRYRYPNRRSAFTAAAPRYRRQPPPKDPQQLRRHLLDLKGVGPKTAALIIAAVTGGHAAVPINDIWLRRALTPAGVFRREWDPEHHYDRFEETFLQYARQAKVKGWSPGLSHLGPCPKGKTFKVA